MSQSHANINVQPMEEWRDRCLAFCLHSILGCPTVRIRRVHGAYPQRRQLCHGCSVWAGNGHAWVPSGRGLSHLEAHKTLHIQQRSGYSIITLRVYITSGRTQ